MCDPLGLVFLFFFLRSEDQLIRGDLFREGENFQRERERERERGLLGYEESVRMASESDNSGQTKDAALESIAQARGVVQEQGFSIFRAAQERYQAAKDATARRRQETADSVGAAKDQTAKSAGQTKDATAESTKEGTQQTGGDTWEGTKQTVFDYGSAAADKASDTWDVTRQKACDITGAAKKQNDQVKGSNTGETLDSTNQTAAGAAQQDK